nr:hypothetical protein Itr_chr10CG12840 [Ipomoea trifida]
MQSTRNQGRPSQQRRIGKLATILPLQFGLHLKHYSPWLLPSIVKNRFRPTFHSSCSFPPNISLIFLSYMKLLRKEIAGSGWGGADWKRRSRMAATVAVVGVVADGNGCGDGWTTATKREG